MSQTMQFDGKYTSLFSAISQVGRQLEVNHSTLPQPKKVLNALKHIKVIPIFENIQQAYNYVHYRTNKNMILIIFVILLFLNSKTLVNLNKEEKAISCDLLGDPVTLYNSKIAYSSRYNKINFNFTRGRRQDNGRFKFHKADKFLSLHSQSSLQLGLS